MSLPTLRIFKTALFLFSFPLVGVDHRPLGPVYDPRPEEDREFVARAALGKALIISAKGGTKEAARAARFFAWTRTYRRTLRKVRALNALPAGWRGPVIRLYNALAWRLARKGL